MRGRRSKAVGHDTIALDFQQWVAGRRGISPLYEVVVSGILADREMQALIAKALPISLICNRFMASVHYLLLEGANHPLREYYETIVSDAREHTGCYPHFRDFCFSHAHALLDITRKSEVQINEVRRSAAFLLGLNSIKGAVKRDPIALIELGACAGFNLNLDLYQYDFGGAEIARGNEELRITCELRNCEQAPSMSIPVVGFKLGIDVAPIDVKCRSDRNRLVAFASPDDRPRQRYLEQAIAVCLRHPVEVRQGMAGELIDATLQRVPPHLSVCVLHALTEHHFDDLELAKVNSGLRTASLERDVHVIGFEWPRRSGVADMQSDLDLTLTRYRHGRRVTRLLATSRAAGGSAEWLNLTGEFAL